ncbi:MAG: amino acid-binding protein [Candidatus Aquicultor secundus]|uniref:Amino acid-binding protein n=2 Tax=Candidatus Aquicultor secundus TaxID=1973895 RepID=A0A2M7T938_9ACTN|nr:ACT domain-containing protein [Candidatus Aquicultor secundus]OIO84930.1 MAG: amino acid-binding protein [Candidatus Aquicultor secundus]PIU26888.1 MAG: amino acid-binding protein [Candidatus Aquicultor secundus]PIZ40614.1 MAG: amino acid-binding protein [Candidatus Aquicultor secundus]
MKATQLSVFLENKQGRLADVTKALADNGINIRALFIADTSDFGILRMIVDKPRKAIDILKSNAFTVKENEVLAVEVADTPGSLAQVLETLDKNSLNVEYLYCFVDKKRNAAVDIMRIQDIGKAMEALENAGIKLLSAAELHEI